MNIHLIPAQANPITPKITKPKLRVAAYARVSTSSDEQLTSFENQVAHYSELIASHRDWVPVGVYSDEGISGLSTRRREGLNRLLADARAGRIDLILTKSISRFARNTVDTLTIIRELKDRGIEIYFEKENIHTLDSKGELLITIMSSIAQEESRSISENITWGIRQNMARGNFTLPYSHFLGYTKGPDGRPEIVEEEAKIVRRIFHEFLAGFSLRRIARGLEAEKIPTPSHKNYHWIPSTIASILRNEKYKGDALLQKVYTVDFLSHTLKQNKGERPQYYIEQSHPAIISRDIFDKVQAELDLRAGCCGCSVISPFQGILTCSHCGARYCRFVRYRYKGQSHFSWGCKNRPACPAPTIQEETITEILKKELHVSELTRPFLVAHVASISVADSTHLIITPKE